MTLIDLMIDQYERSSKWNNVTLGNASFRIENNLFKSPWIRNYVVSEVLTRLEKGSYEQDEDKMHLLLQCLLGIDQLEAPIFKRVFSKRYLKNSKIFEKQLQSKIISIAKKYSDEIDDEMVDSDILSQLYIEEYSQEMHIKGSLFIEVEGNFIDTGFYRYGTVLNTQTLKNASIVENQNIKKILTIENKANFEAEPFEDGTLIIFSHGYFTPLERIFLNNLKIKLEDKPIEYFHSSDLDYGGVCIFKYIKNRIFPDLKPYKMDKETFEQYQSFGEPIEESTLEKLKKCEEPLLQEVIHCIIETGLVIEQEAYL